MADGAAKRVDQLRKGDSVATPAGPATVGCVVESLCANGAAELVALGDGLLITPYHPVRGGAAGEWRFPHTMALRVSVPCAAVYNVVLDRGHEVAINGVQCVTLAHGFADSAVRHVWAMAPRPLFLLFGLLPGSLSLPHRPACTVLYCELWV